ncbi:MAG TPA: thioredoxin family protein, partial [Salinimicrobium sp.]|nr:thioredoxin family protein [Salinimicrobium sp.]
MSKIPFFIITFFFTCALSSQEIKWMSMNEALAAQEKEPRKIFMDVYTTWCGPCKMLERNTFSDKDVAAYINEHYYPVKFNAEGNSEIKYKEQIFTNPGYVPNKKGRNSRHEFAAAMKIQGYPSLVFFDEQGNLLGPITGYRTPPQLEIYLKLFAT